MTNQTSVAASPEEIRQRAAERAKEPVEVVWKDYSLDNGKMRLHTQTINHGVLDTRGRQVGHCADIEQRCLYLRGEDGMTRMSLVENEFHVSTRSLRDGQTFGAIPRSTIVVGLEAAKALAVKKLQDARRRVMRQLNDQGRYET